MRKTFDIAIKANNGSELVRLFRALEGSGFARRQFENRRMVIYCPNSEAQAQALALLQKNGLAGAVV